MVVVYKKAMQMKCQVLTSEGSGKIMNIRVGLQLQRRLITKICFSTIPVVKFQDRTI